MPRCGESSGGGYSRSNTASYGSTPVSQPDYADQGEYSNDWGGAQIVALGGEFINAVGWSGWSAGTDGPMQMLYSCDNVRTVRYGAKTFGRYTAGL